MANSSRTTNVLPALPIALMVVGLGMVLIAGLAGVVLWLMTRRRATVPKVNATNHSEIGATNAASIGEPAEA